MSDPIIGPVPPPALHVMSFNVRRRMTGPLVRPADRWDVRAPAMRALLQAEKPTIVGTQEAMPRTAREIREFLGPEYRFVGHGREADGHGEGCPVFYDTERLRVVRAEQQALSDTPDVAGSRGWGNLVPRILVSIEFEDRATGARFLFLNTHVDHLSRRSRLRASVHLREIVASQPLPAILTGDFNAGEHTVERRALIETGVLRDTWNAAAVRRTPSRGTFGNYREPRPGRRRIDMIAVTPTVGVTSVAINPHRFGRRWPSDHLPVQAVLQIPAPADAT